MASNAERRQFVHAVDGSEVSVPYPLPETGNPRLHQIIGPPARNGRPAIPGPSPVSRSTWPAGVKSGCYPQPVRALGPNITAWRWRTSGR